MKAVDYIKENWGDAWLTHNWEAGDVIDALEEFASLKSQLSEAGEEKPIIKKCRQCMFFDLDEHCEPCESCYPIAYSYWQPRYSSK